MNDDSTKKKNFPASDEGMNSGNDNSDPKSTNENMGSVSEKAGQAGSDSLDTDTDTTMGEDTASKDNSDV